MWPVLGVTWEWVKWYSFMEFALHSVGKGTSRLCFSSGWMRCSTHTHSSRYWDFRPGLIFQNYYWCFLSLLELHLVLHITVNWVISIWWDYEQTPICTCFYVQQHVQLPFCMPACVWCIDLPEHFCSSSSSNIAAVRVDHYSWHLFGCIACMYICLRKPNLCTTLFASGFGLQLWVAWLPQ